FMFRNRAVAVSLACVLGLLGGFFTAPRKQHLVQPAADTPFASAMAWFAHPRKAPSLYAYVKAVATTHASVHYIVSSQAWQASGTVYNLHLQKDALGTKMADIDAVVAYQQVGKKPVGAWANLHLVQSHTGEITATTTVWNVEKTRKLVETPIPVQPV